MNSESKSTNQDKPLKPGEVLVFSEENHEGQKQLITQDTPSFEVDFAVASFRLGPKTGVTLFSEAEYQGLSQQVTTELSSLKNSKLQGQKARSLKTWLSAGKAFTGYWAIEVAEGKYLSVRSDTKGLGVLTTSPMVSDSEAFRIADQGRIGPGRLKAAFQVRQSGSGEPLAALRPRLWTLADLEELTMVDEPTSGFRKFSLLLGKRWISYSKEEDRFRMTTEAQERTIFCQSFQIAENETQVGELRQGEIALFENPCYWGKAWVFHKDYADFSCVLDLNDEVASLQLGPLTGATIYREAQFKADDPRAGKQDVISDISSLANEQVGEDRISSVDLWLIKPPASLDVAFTCSLSQDYRGTGDSFQEYSAYRTTLRLPPTVETVDVWAMDETVIEVDNQPVKVSEDEKVTLNPNLTHSLVITTDARVSSNKGTQQYSLNAPGLKIRTNTMQPEERIVIFPDQAVHERLANLKEDELWNATYKDEQGTEISLLKGHQTQAEVANVQSMVTKIMSTVKYTEASGVQTRSIDPEELHGRSWALKFATYRVNATTLYVREGPGIDRKPLGFLRKDDRVEALEFSPDGGWVKLKRPSDGLTGWSSRLYLDNITDESPSGDRYRVTAAAHLYVREKPGIKYRAVGTVQNNEIVTNIENAIEKNKDGTWRQICREDGLVGWSSASYLALILPPTASEDLTGVSFRVTGSLNLRKGAGKNYATIGYLQTGEVVKALGEKTGSWLKVCRTNKDGSTETGWAWNRYLTVEAAVPPPLETIPSEMSKSAIETQRGYGLVPETNLYEMSQEQVEALLANAQAPDGNLAQGFFGLEEIFKAVKNCVSLVVAKVQKGLVVVVNLADNVVKWIIDTAEKAVAFVEGIFERIGVGIGEAVKWLRYVFDWDDILQTRDTLKEIIIKSLDYVGQTLVPKAKEPVKQFFKDNKKRMIAGFDAAITALGGTVDTRATTPSMPSNSTANGMLDTIEWILSKVMSGGSGGFNFATESIGKGSSNASTIEGDKKLLKFWDETITEGLEGVAVLPTGVEQVITTLVKNPDQPLLAVAELLKIFRSLAEGILDIAEDILLGLLDLATYLIEKFKEILIANIRVPFISDLLEWMGKPALTLGFSLLDAATLILAVPFTAVYKALFNEIPFRNVRLLAQGYGYRNTLDMNIMGYLSSCINSLICIPLDIQPEIEGPAQGIANAALEDFSMICAFFSWLPSLYSVTGIAIPAPNYQADDERDWQYWSLFAIESIFLLSDGFSLWKGSERFKRLEKCTIVAASALGLVHVVLLIANDIKNNFDPLKGIIKNNDDFLKEIIPNVVMTLPEPFSWLRLFNNPYALGFFGVLDGAAALAAGASLFFYAEKFSARGYLASQS